MKEVLLRSKNAWIYTSTPSIRLHGVVLSWKKHRNNFTFTFTVYVARKILLIAITSAVYYKHSKVLSVNWRKDLWSVVA